MVLLVKQWMRRVAGRIFLWRMVHELRRSFAWAVSLPCDEARVVITRWRWQMLRNEDVDEEIREHYLRALGRLEELVKAREEEEAAGRVAEAA